MTPKYKTRHKTLLKLQIEELEEKLSSKKLYMEELQENEKILYDSFTEQLGENNKFADYLTKVFKKKIKRVKKAAEMDGGTRNLVILETVPFNGYFCETWFPDRFPRS